MSIFMIKLVTRRDVVKNKKIMTSELAKIQQSFYDGEVLQLFKDDNEEYLYWEQFDFFNGQVADYIQFNKVIGLDHSDIISFAGILKERLLDIFKQLDAKEFVVLSHIKLDFFGNRNNDFEPLANSYSSLELITGGTSYKEALIADDMGIADLMGILFWITRCDPGVPEYIFVFDKEERIQFNICKYGNLHLTEFGRERLSRDLLEALGWKIIEGYEYDNFSGDGKNQGRVSPIIE